MFDKLRNSRAVQMSVTMIVILIIAIVALGLIISFIRVFFGEATDLVGQQFQQVKDELEKRCEQSGRNLCMNWGDRLRVEQGEPQDGAFTIRNTGRNPNGDEVCFLVGVYCTGPNDPNNQCSLDRGDGIYVGGRDLSDPSGASFVDFDSWVTSIDLAGRIPVENGGVHTGVIRFAVPADNDIYSMKLVAFKETKNNDCQNAIEFAPWKSENWKLEVQ